MSFLQEFKQFALKGNVVDLAVGIIIGAAFGKIVDSAVNDLIMPVVGRLAGKHTDFSGYYVALSDQITPGMSLDAVRKAGYPAFAYGSFLTVGLNFLIVAFAVFLLVKGINMARHVFEHQEREKAAALAPSPSAPPEPSAEEKVLIQIRDLLAAQAESQPPKLGS